MALRKEVAREAIKEGCRPQGPHEGSCASQFPLRNTLVVIESRRSATRFRVDSAQVRLLGGGRRPIQWQLTGRQGSVTIELPRVQAWDLSMELHEESIVPDRPPRKKPRKRSS